MQKIARKRDEWIHAELPSKTETLRRSKRRENWKGVGMDSCSCMSKSFCGRCFLQKLTRESRKLPRFQLQKEKKWDPIVFYYFFLLQEGGFVHSLLQAEGNSSFSIQEFRWIPCVRDLSSSIAVVPGFLRAGYVSKPFLIGWWIHTRSMPLVPPKMWSSFVFLLCRIMSVGWDHNNKARGYLDTITCT